jgi:hypothetical protein
MHLLKMGIILGHIAVFFLVVAFFLFLSKIRNKDKSYKLLTIYLGVISCTELSYRLAVSFTNNNNPVVHIDTMAQFVILSLFYLSLFTDNLQRNIVKLFVIVLPIFFIIKFSIYPEILLRNDPLEYFLFAILLVIYAAIHLYNILNKKKQYYYFSVGLMLFLLASLIVSLTINLRIVLESIHLNRSLLILNNFFYLMFQIFVIVEWILNYYKKPLQNE